MKTPRKIQEFSSIDETVTRVLCGPDNTAVITGLYRTSSGCKLKVLTWLPLVIKWSGKNITHQGQGKVKEFYFDSAKIDILKKKVIEH